MAEGGRGAGVEAAGATTPPLANAEDDDKRRPVEEEEEDVGGRKGSRRGTGWGPFTCSCAALRDMSTFWSSSPKSTASASSWNVNRT